MAKLRMAHASTHGARKPPGPKKVFFQAFFLLFTASVSHIKGCLIQLIEHGLPLAGQDIGPQERNVSLQKFGSDWVVTALYQ